MGVDPEIGHLDDPSITPFNVIDSLDRTIRMARLMMLDQIQRIDMRDAKKDCGEALLVSAVDALWSAREHLVSSLEVDADA
jgi:hypothetical protein